MTELPAGVESVAVVAVAVVPAAALLAVALTVVVDVGELAA